MKEMILVTGATGLVGAHLLVELIPQSTAIKALYRSEEKRQNALKVLQYYGITTSQIESVVQWEKVDILDLVHLKSIFHDVTHVYHCAALVSFHKMDYNALLQNNVEGTANVVNLCLKYKIQKLVHMSSVAAIGDAKEGELVTEESKWASYEGKSGYAVSKKHGEREVWRGIEEGLNAVIVNPTVIFGAAALDQSSIVIFDTVLKGQKFYTIGSNATVDARDVASVMHKLMRSSIQNQRFLLVGENASFKHIMNTISLYAGKKGPSIAVGRILPPVVKVLEFICRIVRIRPLLAYDSAKASISHTKYSSAKTIRELDHTFYSLEDSIKNVLKFNGKLKF